MTMAAKATKLERLLPFARAGDAFAQNYVGYCYAIGYGVLKNRRTAGYWFKKAVKQGNVDAIYNLALQSRPVEEFRLYRRGAETGDPRCLNNLGVLYSEGIGTRQNLEKAVGYWRRAAAKGDSKAEFNLGQAYIDGEGVRGNKAFAKQWLKRAHLHGNRKATALLKQISKHRKSS
jgi:uncharacterized protein